MIKFSPFSAVLLSLFSQQLLAADLTIAVENIQHDEGEIHIALFTESDNFPEASDRSQGVILPVNQGMVSATFTDLDPGDYAIALFHDQNDNQVLDTNFFGIPNEPYGFSRNSTSIGAPNFSEAKISLSTDNINLVIQLR